MSVNPYWSITLDFTLARFYHQPYSESSIFAAAPADFFGKKLKSSQCYTNQHSSCQNAVENEPSDRTVMRMGVREN